ncbi:MAG: NYN domain-containing protein [Bacteroidota bacterium]|nr:NYN domain-containing protein [Bacteroidota bacterium]
MKGDEPKRNRQKKYLEALQYGTATKIYYGQYQVIQNGITCGACGDSWDSKSEKMTDVQIATQLLTDAFTDKFDTAILITADSDLVPPIKMIKEHFPHKQIQIFFPPQRFSYQLQEIADVYETLDVADLNNNQLPNTVTKPDGYVLHKPAVWI